MAVSPHVISSAMFLRSAIGIPVVLAEVLDKEPSIQFVWMTFLSVAIVGYFLCRFRWWLVGITVPVALGLSFIWLTELLDPYVGPAIWHESRSYVIQSYAGMLIALMVPCIGAFLQRKKQTAYQPADY